MKGKSRATGASGLAGHINPAVHHRPEPVVHRIGKAESKRRRNRGKAGEREVVKLYVANGFPRAMRQPGSGALRDTGGLPILPGDIRGVDPWAPVEVKFAEAAAVVGRGWPGEVFVRKTLKKLASEWRILPVGSGHFPVLWARSNHGQWRVFVPTWLLVRELGGHLPSPTAQHMTDEWAEVTPDFYFQHLARPQGEV